MRIRTDDEVYRVDAVWLGELGGETIGMVEVVVVPLGDVLAGRGGGGGVAEGA